MGEASESSSIAVGNSSILQSFLIDNPSVEFIRFQWVDYSGLLMVRVATKAWVLSLDEKKETITTPSPITAGILIDGTLLVDDINSGIDQLWPDWSSVRLLPYHPNHASVMCFVQEGEQGPTEGKGFRFDPRSRLRDIVVSAKEKHDIDFLVGMEIEFFIMEEVNGVLKPVNTVKNVYSTASIRNKYLPILEEIALAFQKAGIKVRQFHSEGDSGAFEISTEPLPPLQSADALYFCHETIKSICVSHGLRATMFPKPFEKMTIIGSHYHLSISQRAKEESFLAGMLGSWRGLAGFYQPNYDSHERVRPGERITWGLENKTASIRKVRAGHWELRGVDATANSYLALFAIIAAGLAGIESDKELTVKNCTKIMFTAPLEDKEAEEAGVTDLMPATLKEALDCLKKDEVLREKLGAEIVDRYLNLKTKEEGKMRELTPSERRELAMSIF